MAWRAGVDGAIIAGNRTQSISFPIWLFAPHVPPSDNRVISDPIEQWLYFFRRADQSTAEELTARLPDPVFAEATGVPAMIAKNPDERRLYLNAERGVMNGGRQLWCFSVSVMAFVFWPLGLVVATVHWSDPIDNSSGLGFF